MQALCRIIGGAKPLQVDMSSSQGYIESHLSWIEYVPESGGDRGEWRACWRVQFEWLTIMASFPRCQLIVVIYLQIVYAPWPHASTFQIRSTQFTSCMAPLLLTWHNFTITFSVTWFHGPYLSYLKAAHYVYISIWNSQTDFKWVWIKPAKVKRLF